VPTDPTAEKLHLAAERYPKRRAGEIRFGDEGRLL
jgi:hypothetical protein